MLADSTTAAAQTPTRVTVGIILLAVLVILALQLPWISRPPFDAHCFRQAQTLSTIELFALEGIDMAHPKTNYVGEPGVFVLEFPLFQALCALLYGWFGPHVWLVRLANLLFMFGNTGLTFAIGKRLFNREVGFASMLIYLFAPLNLVYMTSTLIDPSATFCSLTAFLFALRILYPPGTDRTAHLGDWTVFALACIATALIKTLYLFPTCVLLAATFLARRKLSLPLFAAGLCMVAAAGLFFLWLHHSRHVNDASYFTRDVNPTTLLGFKPLASIAFYKEIARRVLLHLMGPAGAVLAAIGIIAVLRPRSATKSTAVFPVVVPAVSVLGYLVVFAKANFPHDYYSLIVSPYACMVAGFGAGELARRAATSRTGWIAALGKPAVVALAAVALSTAMFLKRPRLAPSADLQQLQRLSEGRFDRWSFAMVFMAPDARLPLPTNMGSDMPHALYATGLRGTGHLVADGPSALAFWNAKRSHFMHLKYVVFYGLRPPEEIVQACRETIVSDDAQKWFAYRLE